MIVSSNELRRLTVEVLKDVDRQIEVFKGITNSPEHLTDDRGNFQMPLLLQAKAQCLNTLTLLNEKEKK